MKKLIYLLFAYLLVFSSCSNDNSESLILPKAISVLGGTAKTIITYNGNKIVNKTNGGLKINYFYTGDLITKIETVDTSGANVFEYTYTDNKLTLVQNTRDTGAVVFKSKEVYSYNSDGTVLRKLYEITNPGNEVLLDEVWRYTVTNGNITKYESLKADGSVRGTTSVEYDNQNNAFKNVLGMDKLILAWYIHGYENGGGRNNMTKMSMSTFSYKYNSKGYPIEMKEYYKGNSLVGTTTYAY